MFPFTREGSGRRTQAERWCALATFAFSSCVIGLLVIATVTIDRSARRPNAAPILFVLLVACYSVGIWIEVRARRRGMTQVADAGFRLCLNCRYPLAQEVVQAECPECGRSFTIRALILGWQRTYPKLAKNKSLAPLRARELIGLDDATLLERLQSLPAWNDAPGGEAPAPEEDSDGSRGAHPNT